MGRYTIGEVAERSGFSTSALRHYDKIGLVHPVDRTDAGYRVYDERSLDRLGFISRAKQLGCTIEEAAELVELWERDECPPVQQRLHELVTEKIADAESRISELASLSAQLRTAAARLDQPPVDGSCGPSCACSSSVDRQPVALTAKPTGAVTQAPPIACTLDAADLPERLEQWQAVLDQVDDRAWQADGTLRLSFGPTAEVSDLARLVAAEQGCCAFFAFSLTVDGRGVGLEVGAPPDGHEVLVRLFGEP